LEARREALELSLGPDVSVQLKDAGVTGIAGRVGAHLGVEAGWEAAVAAALGPLGEAIVADDLAAARRAVETLKTRDKGRAALLLRGVAPHKAPQAPAGARWAIDVVKADEGVAGALSQALAGVVVTEDLARAVGVVAGQKGLTAVTRDGDVVSSWALRGGADVLEGELQTQAALRQTDDDLAPARRVAGDLQAEMVDAQAGVEAAQAKRDDALAKLNQWTTAVAGLAEQLSAAKQKAASSAAEAGRLQASLEEAAQGRESDEAALNGLEARLAGARGDDQAAEPDPADKDAAEEAARRAREGEMEARLGLRTLEERAAALAGRADALLAAAAEERAERVAAAQRAERLRREAETAERVRVAALWLAGVVDETVTRAGEAKADAEASRVAAQTALSSARAVTRERSAAFDASVEGTHRDEMARIEARMRVESLSERALSELGLEADVLVAEYGPEAPEPFVREEQVARVRQAERDLAVLGRVNPLALEEFDAMSERHAFLAEQLDDVKRTRTDLLGIIDEVDAQVQEVFAQAYGDVAETFARVFERLFPGGEGRLILTDPGDALLTGVDVEARPAGKKIKRLSLLSGGERSLVAVAFLLSLFIARPSPFYILDEVEAALDDVNLGRLLDIYDELRRASQLLIITHQKRTMEVADALYGITMRGDGVSKVVSQRLVDR
ncbi:MAG: AAA family ATPase, partial [Propionibacteriaceae bacterium]|nr:AAA family ATPase [Propionibacteriaceae bacterium]